MERDFISLMRKLAPDLTDEMTRRAMILERISALQPVGRRQLALKLNLPEREIRNTALLLKDLGYLELDANGMCLSRKAEEVLNSAREFSRVMSGITEMEKTERPLGIFAPAYDTVYRTAVLLENKADLKYNVYV